MDAIITIQELGKRYHIGGKKRYYSLRESFVDFFKGRNKQQSTLWALKDLNLEIAAGDIMGIIGRNGAGKTTLLKILSGITFPTRGSARLKGRVASMLEIGTGFHFELTGRENIYLYGSILGMKKHEIKSCFDEIVDFSGVEKFLDTPIKHYSSGMELRLAFAVAAHLKSEIIMIDELLAVGDQAFQKKCLGKMEQITSDEGRTVLFVSHNMGAIQSLCNRAMLLDQGTIQDLGKPVSVIDSYIRQFDATQPGHRTFDSSSDVYIQSLKLINSLGEVASTINYSDSFQICLSVFSKQKIQQLDVELGIVNHLGIRLLTTQSSRNGVTFDLEPGKTKEIAVSFNHSEYKLNPGKYDVYISIYVSSSFVLDKQQIPRFINISEISKDSSQPAASFDGGLSMISEWIDLN